MSGADDDATSPGARWRAGVAAGEWESDPAQAEALKSLDRVFAALVARERRGFWQRVAGRDEAPRGVYCFGPVGRGKTFLCDLFFASLPFAAKRRQHFHRFMQDVHAALRRLEGRVDPLDEVAADIADDARVVVLDEFHVGDIGDAMILAQLLRGLFARGVVLVTTSNTRPADLYRDGLQRERFLPAIALLEAHCEIVELDSPRDWRLRALSQAPVYLTPPDAAAERALARTFARVARGTPRRDIELEINDRRIAARVEADGAVWFEFDAICDGPRGVADYIEIARAYHTILVSNVPQFTPASENAARRFVELVDEVYDRGVNLVLSAAVPIVELYDGDLLREAFARTESRLIEMQSEDYLGREHCP